MLQFLPDAYCSIVIKKALFSGIMTDICHKLFKDGDHEDDFFIAKTSQNDGLWSCQFVDLDSNRAFGVSFNPEDLENASCQIKAKDLSALAKVAFSTEDNREHRFSVSEDNQQLLWKRSTKSIKIKLCSFPIQPVDSVQLHKEIFELSFKKLKEETESKDLYKSNYTKLTEDRKGLLLRVNQMTNEKKTMEAEMFQHFLPILNAKKDKIRELEQILDEQNQTSTMESKPHEVSSSDEEDSCDKSMDTSQNFLNLSEPLL